jgi:hypothetical protein
MSMQIRRTIIKRKPRVGDVYGFGVISELRENHFEMVRAWDPRYPNEADRSIYGNGNIESSVYHGEFVDLVVGLRVLHGQEGSPEIADFLGKLCP